MQSEMPIPEVAFGRGVDVGELQLAYQPVVDLLDGSVTCVEALVRWDHPTRGLLWPGEFLDDLVDPEAQRRITGWVLGCLPIALAFLLFLIQPEHITLLLTDQLGIQMLTGAVVLQVIGILAIRRIVDVEY